MPHSRRGATGGAGCGSDPKLHTCAAAIGAAHGASVTPALFPAGPEVRHDFESLRSRRLPSAPCVKTCIGSLASHLESDDVGAKDEDGWAARCATTQRPLSDA